MIFTPRRWLNKGVIRLLPLVCVFLNASALAGTIVRVSTSMGDYSIELYDDVAPITVQNFLNYTNRNDYNGTYVHRVPDDGFVVQGGGYRFELYVGPIDVIPDAEIVNEFNVSNTRGTIAMAKIEGFPNSATNQWFINLSDNLSLDINNEGFTVFGEVLGDGMTVLDAIDDLEVVQLGLKAPSTPYFTETYNNPLDFVYLNVEVVERFSTAAHVFESESGLLITSVDVNGGNSIISLNFNQDVSVLDEFVILANMESVIPRQASFEGIASFSIQDNRLRIPQLEVNIGGSVSLISNVVFQLTNLATGQFTLESFDQ